MEALVEVSFKTVGQLLSNNESFRSLVGAVTRLTNLLLVLEEVAADRQKKATEGGAGGQQQEELSSIPLRGEV